MQYQVTTPSNIPLPVQVMPVPTIVKRAMAEFKKISNGSDVNGNGAAGIVVNFIRHKLTPYDAAMHVFKESDEAHRVVGLRVLDAIAEQYKHVPWIVAEVKRQKAKRVEVKPDAIRTWRAD